MRPGSCLNLELRKFSCAPSGSSFWKECPISSPSLCAWRHWVWVRVVEKMCFIAREAQGLHAPSSHVVVFLNLMILEGAEEEQAQ